jgi:hypothetical protein
MLAWQRWKLGWLAPAQVVCLTGRRPRVVTLSPLARPGGTKAVVYRTRNAAVVIEVRARVDEDATLCRPGVLAYRVDFRKGAPATLGQLGVPIDLAPARPGVSASCGRDWRAAYALGRGEIGTGTAFGVRFRLLQKLADGSYRVRVVATR